MGWYRTGSGRLLFGKGGLAKVYEDRGYTPVEDAVAEAEVASGEAQIRADIEGELAAAVDARDEEPVEDVEPSTEHPVVLEGGEALLITSHETRSELTDEEQDLVDEAIAVETPRDRVRK